MRSLRLKLAAGVAALGVAGVATAAIAHDRTRFDANLIGYEEVPAISTAASGTFKARIARNADEISYTLTYGGSFNGSVTQAHIHFGQKSVNGGISVWLCANNPPITAAPAGTPPCPQAGTLSGTIKPENVTGPGVQGIAAGEFDELVRAIRAGVAYANVHTTTHAGGEIRGQLDDGDNKEK